jgi:uncharacterized protein
VTVLGGVRAAGRQVRSLERTEHRPWPLPAGRWRLGQTWEDVFWAHWRVPAEELHGQLPDGLAVEEHDGSAWLGVVAFRVSALRPRGALPLPGLSSFLQLNVRTYVHARDRRPGVWFFSLDASSGLAVQAARRAFGLPWFKARLALDRGGGWRDVECARIGERGKVFSGRYRPAGEVFRAEPGSTEWFLTERYCLYAAGARGELQRAEIHHDRLPLRPAEGEAELTSIAPVPLRGDPLCHTAGRVDVVAWPLERLAG